MKPLIKLLDGNNKKILGYQGDYNDNTSDGRRLTWYPYRSTKDKTEAEKLQNTKRL